MLKNDIPDGLNLIEKKEELIKYLNSDLVKFVSSNNEITKIKFPVLQYPTKVKSMKLDKIPLIDKKLVGIKGQYLYFEDETVINLRSHAGYLVSFSMEE